MIVPPSMGLLTNPVWRRFWYPVAFAEDVQDTPITRTLLGRSLVLWRGSEGRPAAAEDRCPHRDGRLSLGWTCEGRIVCPYHGWQFERDGACAVVPQTPKVTSFPDKFQIEAVRVEERYGAVWVCLDEPARDIPTVPDASLPGWRFVRQFDEIWETSPARLMENSFDPAHTSFVHRATFGNINRPDVDVPSMERTADGLVVRNRLPVVNKSFGHTITGETSDMTVRSTKSTFFAPFLRVSAFAYPSGVVHKIVTSATPIDDDRLQLVQWAVRNDTEEVAPAADVVAFDRRVTLEDKAILEGIVRPYSYDLDANVHIKLDRPTVEIRRIYREIVEGTWSGLAPDATESPLAAALA